MVPFNPLLAAVLVGAATLAASAHAGNRLQAGDLVINLGVVPARDVAADAMERLVHGPSLDRGGQHVLVSVAHAATGAPSAVGDMWLRVRDPRGRVEEKRLDVDAHHGHPDYSGIFTFGWTGDYRMDVRIERPSAPPLHATFSWRHAVR
jgi:hypothetical protein